MMNEQETRRRSRTHSLLVEGRNKVVVYGVDELDSFYEQAIIMHTGMGMLSIEGEDLHIEQLSLDEGQLIILGNIDSISYADAQPAQSGFFSRVLGR